MTHVPVGGRRVSGLPTSGTNIATQRSNSRYAGCPCLSNRSARFLGHANYGSTGSITSDRCNCNNSTRRRGQPFVSTKFPSSKTMSKSFFAFGWLLGRHRWVSTRHPGGRNRKGFAREPVKLMSSGQRGHEDSGGYELRGVPFRPAPRHRIPFCRRCSSGCCRPAPVTPSLQHPHARRGHENSLSLPPGHRGITLQWYPAAGSPTHDAEEPQSLSTTHGTPPCRQRWR